MANNFFPSDRTPIGVVGGGVPVFTDAACKSRAALFDLNGLPLPGNALNIGEGGYLPVFQAAPSVLYVRTASGAVTTLYPHVQRNALSVTGAKGGNAALTSLMSALSQMGIVVDNTT